MSLCVAVSEEKLSTIRDLSETDTIVYTVLRKTLMDELNLSGAISEEKLSITRDQVETDIIVNTRGAVPCETGNSPSVGGLSATREVILREAVMD